jgi:pyruvate/2-oxoglutarate dehydrogenase complex dihydrolipoamide dehydrogenase (E3) component
MNDTEEYDAVVIGGGKTLAMHLGRQNYKTALIERDPMRILGCTVLAAEAGEMIGTVQEAIMAKLPASTLRDGVLSHPTMVEGFNALFAAL